MITTALTNTLFLTIAIAVTMTAIMLLNKKFTDNYYALIKKPFKFNIKTLIPYFLIAPIALWLITQMNDTLMVKLYVIGLAYIIGVSLWILFKTPIAVIGGLTFPLLYYNVWNIYTFNIIALIVVTFGVLFLQQVFTWKMFKIFMALFIFFDIIAVFISKTMIVAAHKAINNSIPVMVAMPANELSSTGIALGLGDIFFAGILCTLYTKELGFERNDKLKFSYITTAFIGLLLLISNIVLPYNALPATVHVFIGFMLTYIVYKINILRNLVMPKTAAEKHL